MNLALRKDNIKNVPIFKSCKVSSIDKQHPIPGKAILKTGTSSLVYTALSLAANSIIKLNQTIANTTIDTSYIKKAKLLISFNGTIGTKK